LTLSNHRRLIARWLPAAALALVAFLPAAAFAERMEGELRVFVRDPNGLPVEAAVLLESWVSKFRTEAQANTGGIAHFKRLPLGLYQLRVSRSGFNTVTREVQIRSAVPIQEEIPLAIETVAETVVVEDTPPLIDPNEPGTVLVIGRERLDQGPFTTAGRGMIEVVNELPGWLLEANAVLHPRGSEYDTQYVIDGIPLYDNRSIGFVPAFEVDEFESAHVATSNLSAEFGRRLGGVIELHTRRSGAFGHHPEFSMQGGSFGTTNGSFSHYYRQENTSLSLGVRAGRTDRYLDPPSLENFTNKASSGGVNGRFEHDFTNKDRLSLYFRSNRVNFLVPNDLEQQAAGQRQDRRGAESAAHAHYQHVFSARTVGAVRGMYRDVGAELWSNPLSVPVFVNQDRGLKEGVFSGSVTVQGEQHTLQLGGDVRATDIREQFLFAESDELPGIDFVFDEKQRATEIGLYIQERVRLGDFVVDAGLRFDRYSLLIEDSALSPRIGLGYYWRRAGLLFRASYDRVFQTPPIENLLLSSSAQSLVLDAVEDAVPVPANRANFYEVGLRKAFFDRWSVDINHYWRQFENYYDDDVFLNTGISFPIAFDGARVEGTEVRLELPRYKGFSSFLSYSNMLGAANSPVTGGLFVEGGEAEELRDIAIRFPISQDQRNTVVSMIRYEPHPRVWFMVRGRYGSGLPVELEDDDDDEDEEGDLLQSKGGGDDREMSAIPPAILNQVNFERGRVRPNGNLDFSAGGRLWRRDDKAVTLQVDVINATDRLNVINFSGLFSGTALAPSRMVGIKLRVRL
jgi:outer membrane cobalamin receptor